MMLPTVIRGLRLAYGYWKIICISRRILRSSPPPSVVSALPRKFTVPAVGLYSCKIARPVVLLPQPDSPTRPSVSPRFTPNEMSTTARTHPTYRCRMMPWVIGKYIFRFFTCSSSPSAVPLAGTLTGLALVAIRCLLGALCDALGVRLAAASQVNPARDAMAGDDRLEAGVLRYAALDSVRTARLERAAGWRIDQ